MSSKPTVIAYHGWGFDHTVWDAWPSLLEPLGYQLKRFDRGYFGDRQSPAFAAAEQPRVVFAHSYGWHLCPADILAQADLLILFSSFLEFHPLEARSRSRSQAMLHQMIRRFAETPQEVLSTFRTRCYHPVPDDTVLPASVDAALLLHDLTQLDAAQIAPRPDLTTLVLHGEGDRIAAPARGQAIASVASPSQYVVLPQAGHALPVTHVHTCWRWVGPLLTSLLASSHP